MPGGLKRLTGDWRVASGWLLVVFCFVYLPAVGHGFVKDDFGWVRSSTLTSWQPMLSSAPMGFYRPLVSLSFALNRAACGVDLPICYGLTNFLLVLGCAVGVYAVGRSLGLGTGAAVLGAALWAFNWHGINMAVLWISGRTALLLVLCATASAAALLQSRPWLAVVLLFAAMLAKEEALTFGVTLVAVAAIAWRQGRIERGWVVVRFAAGTLVASVLYLALRSRSGAFTPANAPAFYQFDVSISRFLSNAPEYLDRSGTAVAAVVLVFSAVFLPRLAAMRKAAGLALVGLTWLAGGLALVVFLPVRSSLYVCLPAVGAALTGAAVLQLLWKTLGEAKKVASVAVALLLPVLLAPVYYARNSRLIGEAELSRNVMARLQDAATAHGAGAVVCLHDNPRVRPSLLASFGNGIETAVAVSVVPSITVWIDSVAADVPAEAAKRPARCDAEFELRGRDILPVNWNDRSLPAHIPTPSR